MDFVLDNLITQHPRYLQIKGTGLWLLGQSEIYRSVQVVVKPVNEFWALAPLAMAQLGKLGLAMPVAGLATAQLHPPPLLFHMCYTSTKLHRHASPVYTCIDRSLCSLDGVLELIHISFTPCLPLGLHSRHFHSLVLASCPASCSVTFCSFNSRTQTPSQATSQSNRNAAASVAGGFYSNTRAM